LAAIAGAGAASATDYTIRQASDGKYSGFSDVMEKKVGRPISDLFIDPAENDSHFWNVVHPAALGVGFGAAKVFPTAELSYTPISDQY